jgi:uncharacterized protein
MAGIKNLKLLLRSMKPELVKGQFVFCCVNEVSNLNPVMTFREKEGMTIVVRKRDADKNHLKYEFTWALITLDVNSSLEAIGFLAAVTKKLADARIPVNAVSAFHHDHLFVPCDKQEKAVSLLKSISQQ